MDWRETPGRPAARWARLGGLLVVGAVAAVGGTIFVLPLVARAFVRVIVLLAAACVWLATSLSTGVSVWTLLTTVWQTAANALATPTVSIVMWSLVVVGALALYWLQRVLGAEEE